MIIELLGIPGSGKSTYSINYIKNNKGCVNPLLLYLYNTSRIRQNINKLLLGFSLWTKSPKVLVLLVKNFMPIKFLKIRTRIKMFLYLVSIISVIDKCQRKNQRKIYILDEGINQVIWAIIYNSHNSEKEIEALHYALLPYFGNEIIYITVNREVVKERLLKRTGTGGSELQVDIKKNDYSLEKATAILNKIVEKIRHEMNQKVKIPG